LRRGRGTSSPPQFGQTQFSSSAQPPLCAFVTANVSDCAAHKRSSGALIRFGLTSSDTIDTISRSKQRETNMNNYVRLIVTTLCFGAFALLTSTSSAQNRAAKLEAIAQQLNLTPEQKAKVLPILREEAPKVQAIKNDNSMSRMQKMMAVKAIHQQTDPQMKAILSAEQYQKLQAIRHQALSDAIH
jgi:hypothetical protein